MKVKGVLKAILAVMVVLLLSVGVLLVMAVGGWHKDVGDGEQPEVSGVVDEEPVADDWRTRLDYSDNLLMVANKKHSIAEYAPGDLVSGYGYQYREILSGDLKKMLSAAKADGVSVKITSAYRSYSSQALVYDGWVARDGVAKADTYSARPGYSEHQTGLVFDFASATNPACNLEDCYGDTVEGAWLVEHAYEYGFILRYTPENTAVTGYKGESWHYRYIGVGNAALYHEVGAGSLEEFLGVDGGDYE